MNAFKNYYFKATYKEGTEYISGFPLPKPGVYNFIDCTFHPRLKDDLKKNYKCSVFINCAGV